MSKQLNLEAFLVLSSFLPMTTSLNGGRRKNASYAALGSGCCLQCRKENSMNPGQGRVLSSCQTGAQTLFQRGVIPKDRQGWIGIL